VLEIFSFPPYNTRFGYANIFGLWGFFAPITAITTEENE